jgi:hypothetical protein
MLRHTFICFFGLLSVLLMLLSPALGEDTAYRRWAIITGGTPEEAAFSDLLTAGLTDIPGLELVERDQLAAIAGELKLSTALSGEGLQDRLRLGRMLHADALVLAQAADTAEGKRLQLIVAECGHGARLYVEQLPWSTEQTPVVAERAKTLVLDVRQRFAGGVKQVIGVPGFVSRSLEHDYDSLQDRYSQLVQNGLLQYPGVAVIETDEARALGRELAIGGEAVQRLMPLFVAGEYRVEKPVGAEPTVSMTVTVTDGGKDRPPLASGQLSLADGARWVAVAVAPKLITASADAKPLTVEAQTAALSARADAFAKLGSYRYSTALREAALLLDPDLSGVRLVLANEYFKRTREPFWNINPNEYMKENPAYVAAMAEGVGYYLAALPHIEYLLRNKQVYLQDAVDLGTLVSAGGYLFERSLIRNNRSYRQLCHDSLARAQEGKRRFHDMVFSHSLSLPHDQERLGTADWFRRFSAMNTWTSLLLNSTRFHFDRPGMTAADLDHYRVLLKRYVPEGVSMYALAFPTAPSEGLRDYTAEEHARFLDAICRGTHHTARLRARLYLADERYRANRQDPNFDKPAFQKEVEQLLEEYRQIPHPEPGMPPDARRNTAMDSEFLDLIRRITRDIEGAVTAARADRTNGAVVLQPFEMKIQPRFPGDEKRFDDDWQSGAGCFNPSLVRCGEKLEVWWSGRIVALHRTPGLLEAVYAAPQPIFDDVAWDGRFIWVAVRGDGIRILNADGAPAGVVTEAQGLPPAGRELPVGNRALVLTAVAPGKVVAVGSFGKDARAWCALVTLAQGKATVKVFHEATRTPKVGEDANALRLDPALAFWPTWKHRFQGAGEQPAPILLVGRGSTEQAAGLSPLQIDLETLKVSIYDRVFRDGTKGLDDTSVYSCQGKLAVANTLVQVFAAPGTLYPDGLDKCHIPLTNGFDPPGRPTSKPPDKVVHSHIVGRKQIVPGNDGWVYVPFMERWYRFDPKTMTGQRLGKVSSSGDLRYARLLGVSVHLGLLGYNSPNGRLYRLSIDEVQIPEKDE